MWKEQKIAFSKFFVLFCFYFICWKDGVANTSNGRCCRKTSWNNGLNKSLVSDILSFRCMLDIPVDMLSKNWKIRIGSLGIRFRLKIECGNHNNIGAISSHKFGERRGDPQNYALGHFSVERAGQEGRRLDGAASALGNQERLVFLNPSQESDSRR